MKVLIADYESQFGRDVNYEKELLQNGLKDVEIEVYIYHDNREELLEKVKDIDVFLTGLIKVDKEFIDNAPNLKCISVNATGYGIIDCEYAAKKNIMVSHIAEYCTQEVADHVLALMLSLTRGLKEYNLDVERDKNWRFKPLRPLYRLEGRTMALVGFGRIGQAVAKRVQGFGIKVIAVDPFMPKDIAESLGVKLVDAKYALENSDIISNHMNETEENKGFFNKEAFESMKEGVVFINTARGTAVDEDALLEALDTGKVRAAGLDVLVSENPDLDNCPFLKRDNVIVTPHSAFYSETSIRELQRIACENAIHYLNGEPDKIFKVVNGVTLYKER